jgi:pyrimidine deaminase RibD-like protein
LRLATELAYTSKANKRHGCVIIKGGRCVGKGINKYVNKPYFVSPQHMDRCSVHAEVAAIRSSRCSLKGATIYVARINNKGQERYSAPCEKCQPVLAQYGIRKVVYTVWTQ